MQLNTFISQESGPFDESSLASRIVLCVWIEPSVFPSQLKLLIGSVKMNISICQQNIKHYTIFL